MSKWTPISAHTSAEVYGHVNLTIEILTGV